MNNKKFLNELFTEPIAKSLCDSGSTYGYNYEGDISTGLREVECNRFEEGALDIEVDVSTYDLLKYHIEDVDYEAQEAYNSYIKENGFDGYSYIDCQDFIKEYYEKSVEVFNTYNYTYMPDRVLQYMIIDDYTAMIQLHNGCDVRSGYTYPKFVEMNDTYDFLHNILHTEIAPSCDCEGVPRITYREDEIYLTYEDETIIEDELRDIYDCDTGILRCPECNEPILQGWNIQC